MQDQNLRAERAEREVERLTDAAVELRKLDDQIASIIAGHPCDIEAERIRNTIAIVEVDRYLEALRKSQSATIPTVETFRDWLVDDRTRIVQQIEDEHEQAGDEG